MNEIKLISLTVAPITLALTISFATPVLAANSSATNSAATKFAIKTIQPPTAKPKLTSTTNPSPSKSKAIASPIPKPKDATASSIHPQNPHQLKAQSQQIFYEGIKLVKAGKSTEAINKYLQAISIYPFDPVYYNELGVAYQQRAGLGDYNLAEKALRKAISIQPKHATPWLNLGACLNNLNDHPGAEQAYRKALELEPEDWHAHENLAVTLYIQQKMAEARVEFAKVMGLKTPPAVQRIAGQALKDIDRYIAKEGNKNGALEADKSITPASQTQIIEVPPFAKTAIPGNKHLDTSEPLSNTEDLFPLHSKIDAPEQESQMELKNISPLPLKTNTDGQQSQADLKDISLPLLNTSTSKQQFPLDPLPLLPPEANTK